LKSGTEMNAAALLKPSNFLNAVLSRYYRLGYDTRKKHQARSAQFASVGLSYEAGLATLNAALHRIGKPPYDEENESVHWPLIAAIAAQMPMQRILEIGTFDGNFTSVLATLFPTAQIFTVDLPDDDPILRQSYERGSDSELKSHLSLRAANLAAPNIHPLRRNSFFLLDTVKGPFDLIWVDGGHLYPEVAWDLASAHHLAGAGGIVMCDDVICDQAGLRDAYVSPDSHTVLEYASQRGGFAVHYFLKRLSSKWSARPRWRKFVALYHKPSTPQQSTAPEHHDRTSHHPG
jgi:predicted O-methyltransferase YrrM